MFKQNSAKDFSFIIIAIAVGACLYSLHLLRRAFVADKFIMPSDSIRPTLVPGDEVWVNKRLMGARITDLHFYKKGGRIARPEDKLLRWG